MYPHYHDCILELFMCRAVIVIRYHLDVFVRSFLSSLCLVQHQCSIQERLRNHSQYIVKYLLVIPLHLYRVVRLLDRKRFCPPTFHDCCPDLRADLPCFLRGRTSFPHIPLQRLQETNFEVERVGFYLLWRPH